MVVLELIIKSFQYVFGMERSPLLLSRDLTVLLILLMATFAMQKLLFIMAWLADMLIVGWSINTICECVTKSRLSSSAACLRCMFNIHQGFESPLCSTTVSLH